MSLAMTVEEREAFLADTHVGVLVVADGKLAPLAVPIWYRYEPGGEIRIVTSGDSRKADLLRAAGRATFIVQKEEPPYQYVSVEGPVEISPEVDFERDVKEVAMRYLGTSVGEMYLDKTAAMRAESNEVVVTIRPERWHSQDYTKFA
jgi:PPOX class probable F420-dependent enzyme